MKQNKLLSGHQGCNTITELSVELVHLGYQTCAKRPKYWIVESSPPQTQKLGKRPVWTEQDIEQWRQQFMEAEQ